jgi:hypothetical protein
MMEAATLKRRSVSTRLHGATSQKTAIFRVYIVLFEFVIDDVSFQSLWISDSYQQLISLEAPPVRCCFIGPPIKE